MLRSIARWFTTIIEFFSGIVIISNMLFAGAIGAGFLAKAKPEWDNSGIIGFIGGAFAGMILSVLFLGVFAMLISIYQNLEAIRAHLDNFSKDRSAQSKAPPPVRKVG